MQCGHVLRPIGTGTLSKCDTSVVMIAKTTGSGFRRIELFAQPFTLNL